MAAKPTIHPDLRALLERAGYVWDEQYGEWSHPRSRRCLDGGIAAGLTRQQLIVWIKTGEGREPP